MHEYEYGALLVVIGGVLGFLLKVLFAYISGDRKQRVCVECTEFKQMFDRSKQMSEEVRWLKETHNTKTSDGAFIWYFPTQAGKDIKNLHDITIENNAVLKGMLTELKETNKLLNKMNGGSNK